MKSKLPLAAACLALASCSAFTAPKDPVTGIRQDAPVSWGNSFNPLDTPGGTEESYSTAMGYFGPFGYGPASWRGF